MGLSQLHCSHCAVAAAQSVSVASASAHAAAAVAAAAVDASAAIVCVIISRLLLPVPIGPVLLLVISEPYGMKIRRVGHRDAGGATAHICHPPIDEHVHVL